MENNASEILLVEDNKIDAEMTMRSLKKGGITNSIIHLLDGELALDFLFGTGAYAGRDTSNKPRVILLDLKMPKVNGIEVLQQIKGNDLTRRIPVVVLTSSKEHPDVAMCYDLGANSYIVKPVGFENFSKAVVTAGMFWVLLNQPPN